MTNNIRLGLCCCINTLRKAKNEGNVYGKDIYGSRTCTLATMQKKGIDFVRDIVIRNLEDTLTMLEWSYSQGVRVFRMTSDLFPQKSNPKAPFDYGYDFAQPLLDKIGAYAREQGMRLTFHPGQYNVVGTPRPEVFQATVAELSYHAEVLDRMRMPADSVMVVHGGGVYGDKPATIKRWIKQYAELPEAVRNRLVLENCEKSFSITDCLEISSHTGIPVVFDSHHHDCYVQLHPEESELNADPTEYMAAVLDSWHRKGLRCKMHISEQDTDKRIGAHSWLVEKIPEYMLEIPARYNCGVDLMIEAKGKEEAVLSLAARYKHALDPVAPRKISRAILTENQLLRCNDTWDTIIEHLTDTGGAPDWKDSVVLDINRCGIPACSKDVNSEPPLGTKRQRDSEDEWDYVYDSDPEYIYVRLWDSDDDPSEQ